jgi:AcrR family transcriptional regulator
MYRDLVFESAEHVFAEKGFGNATMQDVAREAGISLKTLYATVPGKRDLYQQIQALRGAGLVEAIVAALEPGANAFDVVSRGVRAYVDFVVAHPSFLRIHLRNRISWALGPGGGPEAKTWSEGVQLFAGMIRRGIEDGSFHPGDPEAMAMMGIAVMQVQLARWAEGDGAGDPEALAEEILVQLRRLLCRAEGRAAQTAA